MYVIVCKNSRSPDCRAVPLVTPTERSKESNVPHLPSLCKPCLRGFEPRVKLLNFPSHVAPLDGRIGLKGRVVKGS